MKTSEFMELNAQELEEVNGGIYPLTQRILEVLGAIAGEMNNKTHEDPYWWKSFAH